MIDYNEFDEIVDVDTLLAEIEEAKEAAPIEYVDVPCGTYEVKLTKLELGKSQKGAYMVKGRFRVIEGDYKGQTIFYNQVVTSGFQIHANNEFLKSLETGLDICFEKVQKPYIPYAELMEKVYTACRGKKEFALKYGQNDKGFKTFEILEVFNVGITTN